MKDGVDSIRGDAGEELQHGNVAVEPLTHVQRLFGLLEEEAFVEAKTDAGNCQCWIIVAGEGIEVFGTDFGAAVATVEPVLKEKTHLGYIYLAAGGQLKGADDVLAAVGA